MNLRELEMPALEHVLAYQATWTELYYMLRNALKLQGSLPLLLWEVKKNKHQTIKHMMLRSSNPMVYFAYILP